MCRKVINPLNEHLNILPKVLYKYRRFDSNNYGMDLAVKGEAYFSSARDLNDPFETYFIPKSVLLKLNGEKLITYLREKVLFHFPNSSEKEIQIFIDKGVEQRRLLLKGDPKGMKAVIETQHKKFGILSLTSIPDSLPMWAYYSDGHEGFCVGLTTSVIAEHQLRLIPKNQLLILHKVNYQKNMPVCCVDINSNGMSQKELDELELTLYTKSTSWKHEKEYRLLFYDHPSTIYSFGKNSVTEVVIGINAKKENKKRLIERLTEENPEVKIKQAVKSMKSYTMDFIDVG